MKCSMNLNGTSFFNIDSTGIAHLDRLFLAEVLITATHVVCRPHRAVVVELELQGRLDVFFKISSASFLR